MTRTIPASTAAPIGHFMRIRGITAVAELRKSRWPNELAAEHHPRIHKAVTHLLLVWTHIPPMPELQ